MLNFQSSVVRAGLGLALTGMGLAMTADAALVKYGGSAPAVWVTYGTAALVVFNAGLSVFGSAVVLKVRESQKIVKND